MSDLAIGLPPLSAVRAFEAAVRHGSFTLAAAELGMTQAAVSYQIKLLEERLGAPLFRREKRRVVLTDAGRRAAPQITRAFDEGDHARAWSVFSTITEAIDAVNGAGFQAVMAKAACELLGLVPTRTLRLPQVAATDDEVAVVRAHLVAAGLLDPSH